jgi:hypothetical protein
MIAFVDLSRFGVEVERGLESVSCREAFGLIKIPLEVQVGFICFDSRASSMQSRACEMTSLLLLEATRLAIVMCVAPSRKFDAACVQLGGLTKVASPDVVAVPQEYSSCFT